MNLWKNIAKMADASMRGRYLVSCRCTCGYITTTFAGLAEHLEGCDKFRREGRVVVETRAAR